ncbi:MULTISPECIES: NADP-dependent oxidoreductase [Pseudomonadati]|uniref:NADP-dependent oxidoreductase n=1 Tax=Shewanella aestuarii TaxID=1028752 RepID=A0ABT0KWX7_9GAMM|nr:NADP-dependent oxidoreductase [Shewanella aestuarii]MCL1115974.1 NADP-dependent oxidoreductase [Shewanella aestuarii]GGN69776.1 NADPH:quinone reductase [Shewanella aestuarii]
MKSIVLEKAGSADNLKLVDIAKPSIADNEVLIESKAISVNPVDAKIKYSDEGLSGLISPERPITLGWDVAGTVVAVGSKVSKFTVGDNVFGMVNFPGHGKTYAEFVAAPEAQLATIPENATFTDAAVTTLAALTALQAMKNKVKTDDRVLIHAGSGGVGHFAIQIAKKLGAYVVATSSEKNRDFILSLGADEHIDYRSQDFENVLTDIDFVFDTQGEEVAAKSLKVMRTNGNLVSIAMMEIPEILQQQAAPLNVNVEAMLVASNGDDMAFLAGLLSEGSLKPHVSSVFNFSDMAKAHAALESGRTVGKIALTF